MRMDGPRSEGGCAVARGAECDGADERRTPMKRRLLHAAAMVSIVTAGASQALAQQYWSAPNKNKGALQWVVMLGVVILLSIPAFMNPKRSHMDK